MANRNIKIALISVMVVTISLTIAVFIGYRYVSKSPEKVIPVVAAGSSITIEKIHQTSTRNGVVEWNLDASSATYSDDKKEAFLKDLSVTFFTKDNQKIFLTADNGTLKTETNNIEISGSIKIKNDEYLLKTEKINYIHDKRIIFSKVPVEITGNSMNLVADSMTIYLNTNRAELTGKVEGTFGDNISL
ncbi:MAG: LPS export ABC transporter periplasmic protein LptC [Odoribacter sp.]|nr:LPS export ABC transporter periplasmic protein LptC [Odoribacter sp.]